MAYHDLRVYLHYDLDLDEPVPRADVKVLLTEELCSTIADGIDLGEGLHVDKIVPITNQGEEIHAVSEFTSFKDIDEKFLALVQEYLDALEVTDGPAAYDSMLEVVQDFLVYAIGKLCF